MMCSTVWDELRALGSGVRDPVCKGMSDVIADERPTRLVLDGGIDERLVGSGEGQLFVDWLRLCVEVSGFRACVDEDDFAALIQGIVEF